MQHHNSYYSTINAELIVLDLIIVQLINHQSFKTFETSRATKVPRENQSIGSYP